MCWKLCDLDFAYVTIDQGHLFLLSSLCKTTHRQWTYINVCRVSCGGVFNMLLVLLITFHFNTIYWVVCIQLTHFSSRWVKGNIYSSWYYHHKIGSIHLSHCYHIFRGCVPEVFVTSYSVTYCINVPGKPSYYAVYDECKYSDTFWLADRTRSFGQYTTS